MTVSMNERWNILKDELGKRNQFVKSMLTEDIQNVVGCSEDEAFEYGKSHCNALSFWAMLYAQGFISMDYAEFFRFCYTTKMKNGEPFIKKNGYMNITKPSLLQELGVKGNVIRYDKPPADRRPGDIYQVSINGGHHFIACIVGEDQGIYIFDTNDRGLGVEIGKAFSKRHDRADWFKAVMITI